MDGFANEIKLKAESSVDVRVDVGRWLIAVFMAIPYVLALAFGYSVRLCRYLVAAIEVGFSEGLNGRARDKPKE